MEEQDSISLFNRRINTHNNNINPNSNIIKSQQKTTNRIKTQSVKSQSGESRIRSDVFSQRSQKKERKIKDFQFGVSGRGQDFRNRNVYVSTNGNRNTNGFEQNLDYDAFAAQKNTPNTDVTKSVPIFAQNYEESYQYYERKYRIFGEHKVIKFQIPELSQYYNTQNNQICNNISINQPNSLTGTQKINASCYSFLDFQNDKNKVNQKQNRLDGTLKFGESSQNGFGSNTMHFNKLNKFKTIKSRNFNIVNDEIRQANQQDQNLGSSVDISRIKKKKSNLRPLNSINQKQFQAKSSKTSKIIFSLLGFVIALALILLINNFK